MDSHDRILLRSRKGAGPLVLSFAEEPLVAKQARLRGRMVLKPEIDLGAYVCNAVIDWVDLKFLTSQPTQWIWMKREIEKALGRKCYVQGRRPDDQSPYGDFTVRFQQPEFSELRDAEQVIRNRWELQQPAIVENLEVSIDFRPRLPSEAALVRMFGVLVRSHLPGRDVISEYRDRPRFSWAEGSDATLHVLPASKSKPERNDELLVTAAQDQPVAYDATYYAGAEGSRASWRTMIKLMDAQNRAVATRIDLPEAEQRVRIEVTLNRDELELIGINTLADLNSFKFQTLQGRYFKFRLPTFPVTASPAAGAQAAINAALEEQRRARFLNAGVVGLKALDDARQRINAQRRKQVKKVLGRERNLTPRSRVGAGVSNTFAAYEELTRPVLWALRHLGTRIRASADRSR